MTSWQPPQLWLPLREPRRVTACGCLHREGKVLLERRPDDADVSAGVWDLPGGHLEPGETPEQALVRELHEELGITTKRVRLGLTQDEQEPTSGRRYRHFTYLVDDWDGEPSSRQGQPLAWFGFDDLQGATLGVAEAARPLNPVAAFALRLFLRHAWL